MTNKRQTIDEITSLMDDFLGQFKEGAEQGTSNQDSVSLESLEKTDDVTAKQKGLGVEQEQDAKDGGATASTAPPNTDADKEDPYDEDAPKKLDIDQPAAQDSEVIGNIRKQVINPESAADDMGQKVARAENLGNAILQVISDSIEKEAKDKPLTEEDMIFQAMAQKSAAEAQDYYESHLLGQIQRLQDEAELSQANVDQDLLNKVGGISGLLDKIAAEYDEAVMPEGYAPEVPEAPVPDEVPEVPIPDETGDVGGLADMAGGASGEVGEADIEELAAALDEAGVSPEDLEQAFTDVQKLQEAGVTPDELAQAIEELGGEEAALEAPVGEEVPMEEVAEAPVQEAMPIPEEEKVASEGQLDPARIEAIKKYLKS